ncbi:hypothetical protein [Streptomyces sp. NPDC005281]|uniref:hypothetical protein n=1 Tax=Streptomyces sp. NPDC005281 TaxID=3155712 RepID=UPI0033AAC5C8
MAAWFILPNLFLRVLDQALRLGQPFGITVSSLSLLIRVGVLCGCGIRSSLPRDPAARTSAFPAGCPR